MVYNYHLFTYSNLNSFIRLLSFTEFPIQILNLPDSTILFLLSPS